MVTGEVLPLPGPVAEAPAVGKRAATAGFIAFVMIGLLQAIYGPAIPELRQDFGVSAAVAGLAISANFAGALTGIVVSGLLEERVRLGHRLTVALVLVALGAVALAGAPTFAVVLAGSLAIGLGFGVLDLGFGALFAAGFGLRSGVMSNLLHACFGVGAVTGPLVIGALSGYGFRPLMLGGAAVALALIPITLPTVGPRFEHPAGVAAPPRRMWPLAGFVLLFFLYTGTEISAGGWEPTYLQSLGHSEASASTMNAMFWAALTLGRIASAPLTLRVSPAHMLTGAGMLLFVALTAAQVDALAPAAYALAGFACAPFFPTGLVWLVRVLPFTRGATALGVGAANVGAVVLPATVGVIITTAGAEWTPTVLLVPTALVIALTLVLAATTRETLPTLRTAAE